MKEEQDNSPLELPIDGVLDLHAFRPEDVADLVTEYLEVCRARRIFGVRIIHGKGIGNLRRTVHATLRKNAAVESFALAPAALGGWGATCVVLKTAGLEGRGIAP